MKRLMKLTTHNAKSIYTEANNMNILKLNVAVFSSLLFLLFAGVDTAAGGDYADGKLGKALILDGESQSVKIPHYAGLKPFKGITISAWNKPERVTKGKDSWQQIYRKQERRSYGFMAIGEYRNKHSLCFGLKIHGNLHHVVHGVPLEPADGKIAIRILIDRPMMEIFANHGEQIATLSYENDLNIESVKAFCEGGDAKGVSLKVYKLKAKWGH